MTVSKIFAAFAIGIFGFQENDTRERHWRQDLDELVKGLSEKHKNAFFKVSRQNFESAAAEVRTRIPDLKDHQIAVEFMKLAALIGDGHTGVGPTPESPVQLRRYPISAMWLKDGLFIVAASGSHKDLLRARIRAIGKVSADEAARRVAVVTASDNTSGARHFSAHWLTSPEVLAGLRIIEGMEKGPFQIVDAQGRERTVDLAPVSRQFRKVFGFDKPDKDLPMSRRLVRPWYGLDFLADSKTLYAWYDTCADHPDGPVSAWCEAVLKRLDDDRPARLVFDLRRNSGGNSALLSPLLAGLRKRPEATARGKLFVLTDRRTFSSGLMNALDLRREFKAIVIGLPPGGSPNHYGEVRTFTLPNCKWQAWYSTTYFRLAEEGVDSLPPDLEIDCTSAEFFSGRDPALEAAIKFRP
jgi:hypothetical protein